MVCVCVMVSERTIESSITTLSLSCGRQAEMDGDYDCLDTPERRIDEVSW